VSENSLQHLALCNCLRHHSPFALPLLDPIPGARCQALLRITSYSASCSESVLRSRCICSLLLVVLSLRVAQRNPVPPALYPRAGADEPAPNQPPRPEEEEEEGKGGWRKKPGRRWLRHCQPGLRSTGAGPQQQVLSLTQPKRLA
jgi:hypothetical protein